MKPSSILFFFLGFLSQTAFAQQILIDQPVQAADLVLFPHISDTTKYYYLPNQIALGTDKATGGPQFSFLRWVENVKSSGEESRREGEGGGIVHCLVGLEVTDEQIKEAEAQLKTKSRRSGATIAGPVIFKDGKFTLISSAMDENGGMAKKVIGIGKAPVFEGNKAAVSIILTKQGSKILWESCKTPTPDLSFSFQMDFSGYRSPIKAKIEVDWDKVYDHKGWKLGANINTPYIALGAEIKSALDELKEQGAIKVTYLGGDDKFEAIIDAAYKKLLDAMFEPFRMPESGGADPQMAQMLQMVNMFQQSANANNANNANKQQGATKASPFTVNFAYEMKKQRKTGKYVIDLSKSTMETISFRFDENVGGKVAKCKPCFRQINLDDPLFRQREVMVSVDGLNASQFNKYVNFATVSLKKVHGGDQLSTDEVRIGAKEFADAGNVFRLLYGWKDNADAVRDSFLRYQYKVQWSFFGDHAVTQDWKQTDQMGINLAPPFHPMQVSVEADPALLKEQDIRLATVKFFYDYGGGEKVEAVTLKGGDQATAQLAEFMLKNGQYDFEYEVTWRLKGNRSLSSGRKKSSDTLLYVDEIPADATEVK
ncbi:MAG: hypothetical protein AAB316_17530 [Bacteroidota bacterium]